MVLSMLTVLDTFQQKKIMESFKTAGIRPLDTGQGGKKNKKCKPATQNSKSSTGACFELRLVLVAKCSGLIDKKKFILSNQMDGVSICIKNMCSSQNIQTNFTRPCVKEGL